MARKRPNLSPEDFAELLAQAQDGSTAATGGLLASNRERLLVLANCWLSRSLHFKEEADDLVEEVILAAWEKFQQFRGRLPEELWGWLREILSNVMRGRSRDYYGSRMRDVGREESGDAEGKLARALARVPSPVGRLVGEEFRAALLQALDELPEHSRRVQQLHYCNGLTFLEIGSQMGGLSEEGARKLCARALRELRQDINREGFDAMDCALEYVDGILE